MRSVRLGAVFGALCVLGACIPVDDDPPVQGSKQLQQLSSHEIVAMCDWATDYMGGVLSNQTDVDLNGGIVHRCPGDIAVPTEDLESEIVYVAFPYERCPADLAAVATGGCTLTVNDYASWIEGIGESPCEYHDVSNGQCTLIWNPEEEAP